MENFKEDPAEKTPKFTFGEIVSQALNANSIYSEEQIRLMSAASDKLKEIYPDQKNYSVWEVYSKLDTFVHGVFSDIPENRDYKLTFAVIRKFRHLKDTFQTSKWKTPNVFGDFIAAATMLKLITTIRESETFQTLEGIDPSCAELLSTAFYELSQSYFHLLNNLNMVVSQNRKLQVPKYHIMGNKTEGQKNTPSINLSSIFDEKEVTVNKHEIWKLTLNLLAHANKLNPNNLQAKYRLLEMMAQARDVRITSEDKEALGKLNEAYQAEERTAFALTSKKHIVNNFIKEM
jgi:2C-methyl-D-erythritol 2,4-cyclodiphosphate synthase